MHERDHRVFDTVSGTRDLAVSVLDEAFENESKTHVALDLCLAACQRGMSVSFTTTALVHELIESRDERRLLHLRRKLTRVNLLCIDELGFVPLSKTGAALRSLQPAL